MQGVWSTGLPDQRGNQWKHLVTGGSPLCERLALRSIRYNVCLPLYVEADTTYNLACPASPIQQCRLNLLVWRVHCTTTMPMIIEEDKYA